MSNLQELLDAVAENPDLARDYVRTPLWWRWTFYLKLAGSESLAWI